MTTTDNEMNQLICENSAVKTNCKKQFNCKIIMTNKCNEITKLALELITDEANIWTFCRKIDYSLPGLCYTYIRDYTNKQGITSKAHHTYYGKWCGSIKGKGDKPYLMKCFMPVNQDTFTFDNTKEGEFRFIPKEYDNPIRDFEDSNILDNVTQLRTKKDIKTDKKRMKNRINSTIELAQTEKRELTNKEVKKLNKATISYELYKKELENFKKL